MSLEYGLVPLIYYLGLIVILYEEDDDERRHVKNV